MGSNNTKEKKPVEKQKEAIAKKVTQQNESN